MNKLIPLLLLVCTAAGAQPVRDFTLTDVMTGTTVKLSDQATPVVIIFTGNACAFDNYYAARIQSLVDQFSGKVQFWLINSSVDAADADDKMVERHRALKYTMPYLSDKKQEAMEILGAKKTPDAFLLIKSGGTFSAAYHGAIDDNPQVASDVRQSYLKSAIEKVLASQKVDPTEVRSTGGCTIRKK